MPGGHGVDRFVATGTTASGAMGTALETFTDFDAVDAFADFATLSAGNAAVSPKRIPDAIATLLVRRRVYLGNTSELLLQIGIPQEILNHPGTHFPRYFLSIPLDQKTTT